MILVLYFDFVEICSANSILSEFNDGDDNTILLNEMLIQIFDFIKSIVQNKNEFSHDDVDSQK